MAMDRSDVRGRRAVLCARVLPLPFLLHRRVWYRMSLLLLLLLLPRALRRVFRSSPSFPRVLLLVPLRGALPRALLAPSFVLSPVFSVLFFLSFCRYMADEARSLKAYGELPDNIRVNDADVGDEEGGENDDYIDFDDISEI